MIVYRKKYDKTCKTLRPIKSAMWWVIYLQNKTLIQIKKRNYNILLNYMFFISLYLTLPSYISSSRVCSSRINILFLFLGVGGSPFFSLLFFFSCFFDYWFLIVLMKRNSKIKHLIWYVHYGAMIFQNIQADIQIMNTL